MAARKTNTEIAETTEQMIYKILSVDSVDSVLIVVYALSTGAPTRLPHSVQDPS